MPTQLRLVTSCLHDSIAIYIYILTIYFVCFTIIILIRKDRFLPYSINLRDYSCIYAVLCFVVWTIRKFHSSWYQSNLIQVSLWFPSFRFRIPAAIGWPIGFPVGSPEAITTAATVHRQLPPSPSGCHCPAVKTYLVLLLLSQTRIPFPWLISCSGLLFLLFGQLYSL